MSGGSHRDAERAVARLVGPAGRELSCEECFEHLDRYVELELAGADPEAAIPGMGAHLEGYAACAEDHDSLRTFLLSARWLGVSCRGCARRDRGKNHRDPPR